MSRKGKNPRNKKAKKHSVDISAIERRAEARAEAQVKQAYRSGFSDGVQQAATFYKKMVKELQEAKTIREVRSIFTKYSDEEEPDGKTA